MSVAVLDLGLGNLLSIKKGLERAGANAEVVSNFSTFKQFDSVVLPGVGAFRNAIANLRPFKDRLMESINEGKHVLGVCLGLQMFFERSYEGGVFDGLKLMEGEVVKLPSHVKVPHMGWNTLKIERGAPLLEGVADGSFVYFVHSYYVKAKNEDAVVARTFHGIWFPSVISRKNVHGTQFHPEKSGKTGLVVLKNFVNLAKR